MRHPGNNNALGFTFILIKKLVRLVPLTVPGEIYLIQPHSITYMHTLLNTLRTIFQVF